MSRLGTNYLETEVLIIGSGAGGSVTAASLAAAGRDVTVLEEGPWIEADAMEPFSLEEMVAKYRHTGLAAALGSPGIVYAEGRCVGGSTEINSGLYHRLPASLTDEWRTDYEIDEFTPEILDRYAQRVEDSLTVSKVPGPPPPSSAVLERGAAKLGWRAVEFSRVFRYEPGGRAVKQTMSRTFLPRALDAGARLIPDCRVTRLVRRGDRITEVRCSRRDSSGAIEALTVRPEHVFVCGGSIQTPALLQQSGIRTHIGGGLKLHPTVKIAARFTESLDHRDVPMHRVTEFAPNLTIGGSASRRGHVALALADSGADYRDALDDWDRVAVYYAAIRSEGSGRVIALPGLAAPLVTYRLTDGDMSRLARGLVYLGEVLLAAGATELYPSVVRGAVVRSPDELVQWWDAVSRSRANVMSVHLTSTVRIGENRARAGADSFGRVWGLSNLRINDASLLPDAPGVNPQGAIMAIATRNCDQFLATT
ncbi:MAG: choline dehydrogenase-like flavoprotein [Actinomycetia bacterium]|nr:choline dehydrogenase-like flavoprotein [Actinomycetes bacterium]